MIAGLAVHPDGALALLGRRPRAAEFAERRMQGAAGDPGAERCRTVDHPFEIIEARLALRFLRRDRIPVAAWDDRNDRAFEPDLIENLAKHRVMVGVAFEHRDFHPV